MLINYTQLIGTPVMSLHIGGQMAMVSACIIDPDSLKIIAFLVEGPVVTADTGDVLDVKSIREFSNLGFVVDSSDVLSKRDDIVRVKEIIDLDFVLLGLKVETKKGDKLGKVTGFVADSEDFMIQQLVVKRPTLKSFLDPELLISRNEIIEIDDYKVVVKDEKEPMKVAAAAKEPSNFVNPFRKPDFSQSDSQNLDA